MLSEVTVANGPLPGPPVDAGLGLSLFGPALLVLGLCVVALLAWRWLRTRQLGSGSASLSVMARVELSPQHSLYVVQAGERCLLLGGSPGGLTLLTEMPTSTSSTEMSAQRPAAEDALLRRPADANKAEAA